MKSFSLIEILITVVIAFVAIIALFELAFQNITTAELIRHRLIAAHLAQEGIEIVTNMRTQNWLTPGFTSAEWRGNSGCVAGDVGCLPDGATYIAQYDSLYLTSNALNPPLVVNGATSLYCYGCVGVDSPYRRNIIISKINDHQMKVEVTVSWTYNGKPYTMSIEDRLYNYL